MGNSLLTQSVLIVTSIIIVVTYVRPAFSEIATIQDEITRFDSTVERANELNQALQSLIATERSFSRAELQALQKYLPQAIDEVLIMRDIQNMFKEVGLPITNLAADASEGVQADFATDAPINQNAREIRQRNDSTPQLMYKDFSLSFYGQYEDLKAVIESLEVNDYPLEVIDLTFTAALDPELEAETIGLPAGTMKYDMIIRSYALSGS